MIVWLKGKKTYLLCAAAITYALLGWYLGRLEPMQVLDAIWAALTGMSLRAGMENTLTS